MQGIKVLQIMAGAQHGGAETFFMDLVTALHRRGIDQIVITRDYPERTKKLNTEGIPHSFCSFGKFFDIRTGSQIQKIIKDFKPDIVQTWMGRASSFVTVAPHARAWSHIGWFGGYYDVKRFSKCDAFIGVTHDITRAIHSQGVDEEKCRTIHTFAGIDPGSPPLPRKNFDTPDDKTLFCTLARLHQKKGLDTLLHAFRDVPDSYLWIAGEGEDRNKLENLAGEIGLKNRVRFLGWQDNRAAVLNASDICVFPSRYEPFGTVMVEAWATGTPLIAARAAGPKAYIEDEVNGLLVDIDDHRELAGAMNRLKSDRALQAGIVEGGRQTFIKTFTEDAVVQNYLALYSELTLHHSQKASAQA